MSPVGPDDKSGPLCIHGYEDYRHDCDVCRHTREIAPKLKQSALLLLITTAQGSIPDAPKKQRKRRPETEARRQEDLLRKGQRRFFRALRGERTRVRLAG